MLQINIYITVPGLLPSNILVSFLRDITPCGQVKSNRRFRGPYASDFRVESYRMLVSCSSTLQMEAACSPENSVNFTGLHGMT
jgi:hypothetical protein